MPAVSAQPRRIASAIASPSSAPCSVARQQCTSQAATPSGDPEAYPASVDRYASRPSSTNPTSGTDTALGSSPREIAVSRAAARATTPSAVPNGASAASSPCTSPATSTAGTVDPTVIRPNSPASRARACSAGRPSAARSTRSAAASTCSRARTCPGARDHVSVSDPSAAETRSDPCTRGSSTAPARSSASGTSTPSSAADARAPRSADSVLTSAERLRISRWASSRSMPVRSASAASRPPGRSSRCASGSGAAGRDAGRAAPGRTGIVTATTVRGGAARPGRPLAYAPGTMARDHGARALTLLLVRHGQSEWNVEGRMQGQTPHVPLTALGHEQAAAAAEQLAARRPGALLSSDLHRAVQTAEHCARATGLELLTTPALREQGYGVLEGRPSRELWEVVDWTDPHWSAEGGESLAQLHSRVAGLLAQLREQPPARVVAVVTHGDTI